MFVSMKCDHRLLRFFFFSTHDPFFSSHTLHSLVGSLHKVHPLVRYDNLAMNSETKECLVMRLFFVIILLLWRDLLRFVR